MRVCVLGNSHVASLKLGWDKISGDYGAFEFNFFAARGKALSKLRLRHDALVPITENLRRSISHTSGGSGEIKLSNFDVFVVYGLYLDIPIMDQRLSSAVKSQLCDDLISQALNLTLVRLIRSVADRPIYVGHTPQPAMTAAEPLPPKALSYAEAFEFVKQSVDSNRAHLIRQAPATLDGWNTKPEYSTGSTRLDVGDDTSNELHPDTDLTHMNGDFGVHWLRSLFTEMM